MWMREVQTRISWDSRNPADPGHREQAEKDLLRTGDKKVSFFRVSSSEEIERTAYLFALCIKGRQDRFDYVLLDETLHSSFQFVPKEDLGLHPYLRTRHVELDLEDRNILAAFLDVALLNNITRRFHERTVIAAFEAMTGDERQEIRDFQKQPERWTKSLNRAAPATS
jgi:hypothetical protein